MALYCRGPPPGFGHPPGFGPPPGFGLKKHTLVVSGVPFEVDVKYAPVRVLGNGSYGVVCSCINNETKEMVAVKKIALIHPSTALSTLREMQILAQIRHENVISIKDVMLSSSSPASGGFQEVYLVQDLMDGDLFDVIRSTKLSGDHCKYFLFQILRGLNHLHSANVIHRDLKPENLLVKSTFDLKICDFGLARTKNDSDQFMTEHMTTRWYRAPEILLNSHRYGKEVDMWSVGCIFAEMIGGGGPLFKGADSLDQIRLIHGVVGTQSISELGFIVCDKSREYLRRLPFSPGKNLWVMFPEADPVAVDLLRRMLVLNPDKRISAIQALQHPYFSDIYDPTTMVEDSRMVERVRVQVDEYPNAVMDDERMLRELIWEEMLIYHPELGSY